MIETDVLIVGAGPAGLAAAIALRRRNASIRVLVLDKGRNPGSHVLSGAIIDSRRLGDLLTAEEIAQLPVEAHVVKESFRAILSPKRSVKIPWTPPMMSSMGYPVGSLARVAAYLAGIAEKEGAVVQTGYAVTELVEENGRIVGARTGEKGLDRHGRRKSNYLASEEIRAKATILAEGGAGILTDRLIAAKGMQGVRPPTYALGIKELIELPTPDGRGGEVMHAFGFPSDLMTYGGGFVYHVSDRQVMVGYAYALDYRNPAADPFELFRRFKATAAVQSHIVGGKTVAYGAKTIPEGGYWAVPRPHAPGALIVGDGAGLVDSLRIKGVHLAIESGICAAAALAEAAAGGWADAGADDATGERYFALLKRSEGWRELWRVRNVRAAFAYGAPVGAAAAGLAWLTRGVVPWWRVGGRHEDRDGLREMDARQTRGGQEPGGGLPGPDRLTDVFLSGTRHEEDQPCHLRIGNRAKCEECRRRFGAPCTRFCPAEVYRLESGGPEIDFSNCMHCKTCKIKCPYGNIEWLFPQGGEGPRYARL